MILVSTVATLICLALVVDGGWHASGAPPTRTEVFGAVSGVWSPDGSPYIVTDDVTVPAGQMLTIEPGVVVKLAESNSIFVEGALRAEGTEQDPIYFTSINDNTVGGATGTGSPQSYDWYNIWFRPGSNDDNCVLSRCVVRYGGNGQVVIEGCGSTVQDSEITDGGFGIAVYDGWGRILRNRIERHSGDTGIYLSCSDRRVVIQGNEIAGGYCGVWLDAFQVGDLTDNVIRNNEVGVTVSGRGPAVFGGGNTITQNEWPIEVDADVFMSFPPGTATGITGNTRQAMRVGVNTKAVKESGTWGVTELAYWVDYLAIPRGVQLTILPGVVVKCERHRFFDHTIAVEGALWSEGTAEDPIYFTSANDNTVGGTTGTGTPGVDDWEGIWFGPGSDGQNCVLADCVVRYGGYRQVTIEGCTVPIRHCEITHGNRGIRIGEGGRAQVVDTRIEHHVQLGHLLGVGVLIGDGADAFEASGCHIVGNEMGIWNGSPTVPAIAEDCWWGDASGPLDDSDDAQSGGLYNPDGKGDRVSDGVDYDPWLPAPPGESLRIFSVSPADVENSGPWLMRICAGPLESGATATLSLGDTRVAGAVVSATRWVLEATFDLLDRQAGAWDLSVANPSGDLAVLREAVAIAEAAAPVISDVTPRTCYVPDTVTVAVTGEHLNPFAQIELASAGQQSVRGETLPEHSDESRVSARFVLGGAAEGQWDVVVTNPDGQSQCLRGALQAIPRSSLVLGVKRFVDVTAGELLEFLFTVPPAADLFLTVQKVERLWPSTVSLRRGEALVAASAESGDVLLHVERPEPGEYVLELSSPPQAATTEAAAVLADTALPQFPLGEWQVRTIYRGRGKDWCQVTVPPDQSSLVLEVEILGWFSTLDVWRREIGGVEHWEARAQQQGGRNSIELEIPGPAAGTYYLEVMDSAGVQGGESQVRDYMIRADVASGTAVRIDSPIVRVDVLTDRAAIGRLVFRTGSNQELVQSRSGKYLFDLGSGDDPRLAGALGTGWQLLSQDIQQDYATFDFSHPSGFAKRLLLSWGEQFVETRCDLAAPEPVTMDNCLAPGGTTGDADDVWAVPASPDAVMGPFTYPAAHQQLHPTTRGEWTSLPDGWLSFWDEGVDEVYGFTCSPGYRAQIGNDSTTHLRFRAPAGQSSLAFHVRRPKPTPPYEGISLLSQRPVLKLSNEADHVFTAPNSTLTYTIEYANSGASQATGTVLEALLPPELTYVDGSATDAGTHDPAGQSVRWDLGVLPAAGAPTPLSFQATVGLDVAEETSIATVARLASNEIGVPVESLATVTVGSPVVTGLSPNRGGNTGAVTLSVEGRHLDPQAAVRLTKAGETDIPGPVLEASADGTRLMVVADLTDRADGTWRVEVTNPSGLASVADPASAADFDVEAGGSPHLWVSVGGRGQLRIGRHQTYVVRYGNRGTSRSSCAGVLLSLPAGATATIHLPSVDPTGPGSAPFSVGDAMPCVLVGPLDPAEQGTFTISVKVDEGTSGDIIARMVTAKEPMVAPDATPATGGPHSQAAGGATHPTVSGGTWYPPDLEPPVGSMVMRLSKGGGPGHVAIHQGDRWAIELESMGDGTYLVKSVDMRSHWLGDGSPGDRGAYLGAWDPPGMTAGLRSQVRDEAVGRAGESGAYFFIPGRHSKNCIKFVQEVYAAHGISTWWTAITSPAHIYEWEALRPWPEQNVFWKLLAPSQWNPILYIILCTTQLAFDFVTSVSPEDKFGPLGYDPPGTLPEQLKRHVAEDQAYNYRIDFWNKEDAPAPTQDVFIEDQLDPDLDWSSFEFGDFGFLKWNVPVPPGTKLINHTVDLRPDMSLLVHLDASIDPSGMVRWTFTSLDPYTGQPPEDPQAGFLPPITETGYEIGWVNCRARQQAGLPTGTHIANQAFVKFDVGPWKPAPPNPDSEIPGLGPWLNTIDAGAPSSQVAALPAESRPGFQVSWSGEDDANGSGVAAYDVYVADNGGPPHSWVSGTTETSAAYAGEEGHTYAFYSVAIDSVGHDEQPPAEPDAQTTVVDPPAPVTDLTAEDHPDDQGGAIDLHWPTFAPPPDLEHYRVYRSDSEITDVTDLTPLATVGEMDTKTYTDETTDDGSDYYYAVTGVDGMGNEDKAVTDVGPVRSVDNIAPGPPQNLRAGTIAAGLEDRRTVLGWDCSGDDGHDANDVRKYIIYRDSVEIARVPATGDASYSYEDEDQTLQGGVQYTYTATCTDGTNESEPSNEVLTAPWDTWSSAQLLPWRWSNFSMPVDPENGDPAVVLAQLGSSGQDWSLWYLGDVVWGRWHWKRWYRYPHPNVAPFALGRGYMLLLRDGGTAMATGTAADPTQDLEVLLERGWNCFGTPFTSPVPWGDSHVRVRDGNGELPLSEAVGNRWLWKRIKCSFNGERERIPPGGGWLKPWRSYMIYARTPCTLVLSPPGTGATEGIVPVSETRQEGPDEWQVQLVATAGDFVDDDNFAGVTSAPDVEGECEPDTPFQAGGVGLYFPPENGAADTGPLGMALQAPSPGKKLAWDFEVLSETAGREVEITWPDLSQLPNDYGATLVDLDAGTRRWMRTTASYQYLAKDAGIRRFRLEVAPRGAGSLRVTGVTAQTGRGSGGATIRYHVSAAATVTTEIHNIAGRRVAVVERDREVAAGSVESAWNGRTLTRTLLPNGIYLIKVLARTDDGQQATAIGRLSVGR